MKKIILIGNGGHSSVLKDLLYKMENIDILGFVDKIKSSSKEYLGDESWLLKQDPKEISLVNAVGFIPPDSSRNKIFKKFSKIGFKFLTLVHPFTFISRNTYLEQGVQVMMASSIQTFCRIGANTIINSRVSIDHHCTIGPNCHIAPGSVICGEVTIGEGSFLGAGCIVENGVSINRKSVVKMGTIVKKK